MIESKVEKFPKFKAIDRAIEAQGWKIVFLSRLSPLIPFNIQNYMYGLTKVSFGQYMLASWIGMMPGTLLYVYLGSAAGTLVEAAAGDVERGPAQTAVFIIGLVATVFVTIYVTRLAKKAMAEAAPDDDAAPSPPQFWWFN